MLWVCSLGLLLLRHRQDWVCIWAGCSALVLHRDILLTFANQSLSAAPKTSNIYLCFAYALFITGQFVYLPCMYALPPWCPSVFRDVSHPLLDRMVHRSYVHDTAWTRRPAALALAQDDGGLRVVILDAAAAMSGDEGSGGISSLSFKGTGRGVAIRGRNREGGLEMVYR